MSSFPVGTETRIYNQPAYASIPCVSLGSANMIIRMPSVTPLSHLPEWLHAAAQCDNSASMHECIFV